MSKAVSVASIIIASGAALIGGDTPYLSAAGDACIDPLRYDIDASSGSKDAAPALTIAKAQAVASHVPLCVKKGTYLFASPVSLSSVDNGLIWRSDAGVRYLAKAGSNISLLRADNAARIIIDGGEWDGNMATQSFDNGGAVLDFVGSDFITVRNTYIHDTYLLGIRTMGTNNQVIGNRFGAARRDVIFMTNSPGGHIAYSTLAARNSIDRSAQAPPSKKDTLFGWGIDVQAGSADMVGTEIVDNIILFPAGSGDSADNGPIQILGYNQTQHVQRNALIARNKTNGGGESIASGSLVDSIIADNVMTDFTAACVEGNIDFSTSIDRNSCKSKVAEVGIYEDNGATSSRIEGNHLNLSKNGSTNLKAIFIYLSSATVSDNDIAVLGGKGTGIFFQSSQLHSAASRNNIYGSYDWGIQVYDPVNFGMEANRIVGYKYGGAILTTSHSGSPHFYFNVTGNWFVPAGRSTSVIEAWGSATPVLTGSTIRANFSSSSLPADIQH